MKLPTPLIALHTLGENIYGKVEYLHPSGSMKHRSLPALIRDRIENGEIESHMTIAIRSAGAAAVTTAWAAAKHGLRCVAVLPETAPPQCGRLLCWLGAQVYKLGNSAAAEKMRELQAESNVYVVEQAAEPRLCPHYRAVAAEILAVLPDTSGIVAGLGTGLSAMGMTDHLQDASSNAKLYGVEPLEAALASGGAWHPHRIYGLAPPRARPLLDVSRLAGVENIASDQAWDLARFVARREGLLIGPSSGATLAAALRLAERDKTKPLVAILACSAQEYLQELQH